MNLCKTKQNGLGAESLVIYYIYTEENMCNLNLISSTTAYVEKKNKICFRDSYRIQLKSNKIKSEEDVADIIVSFQMVIWMATNGPLSKSR